MDYTNIRVVIEISKDSNLKFEYDPNDTKLQLDRILPYKIKYPFNYGHVPNTLTTDGQTLDVVLMLDEVLPPGTVITCKIIGGIIYSDEKGQDDKLIVCPANNVDQRFININDIKNLKMETLNKIRYFFQHYKDNLNINTFVGDFLNRSQAIDLYNNSKI
jgi:inorganic pyrophosphatase